MSKEPETRKEKKGREKGKRKLNREKNEENSRRWFFFIVHCFEGWGLFPWCNRVCLCYAAAVNQ